MASKPLEIEIRGSATDLTQAVAEVQAHIGQLGNQTKDLVRAFTGGLIGGGVIGVFEFLVSRISNLIAEARDLADKAESLDISRDQVRTFQRQGKALGVEENIILGGVESARQARSDAAAGLPRALSAFAALGLSQSFITNLSPDELFITVLEAFAKRGASQANRFALRQIMGEPAARELEPFAAGGFNFRSPILSDELGGHVARLTSLARLMGSPPRGIKAELEPFSSFGMENNERARFMAEQNRQNASQIARSTLTAEQQINAALQERVRLQRLINDTADPVRRERLRADLLQLNSQILGLTQRNPGAQGAAAASTATQRPSDALRSLGFDLGRLSSAGPNYPQQLVQQGERHQRTLDEIRTELRKFNE